VDKIAFTGSTAVGKRDGKSSTNLEADQPGTGRQSPNIVFPDADMAAVGGAFWYLPQQRSGLSSRFPFTAARVDQRRVHAAAGSSNKDYQIRRSKDSTTTMGPVINERQFDRIQGYIQAGQTEGAKLLIGGSGRYPVEGFEQGLFVQPTILMRLRAENHTGRNLWPHTLSDDLQR